MPTAISVIMQIILLAGAPIAEFESLETAEWVPIRNLYESFQDVQSDEHFHLGSNDAAETLPWTVMLYDDADFQNGYDPIYSFAEDMRSSDNLNVLVMQDQYHDPAFIYKVLPGGSLEELEALAEVNMSSPDALRYLLSYAQANYPAERYFLAVYDHGGGWYGSCIDYTAPSDLLTMDEKQQVMENFPGIDILAFTAPCLMGATESVYELRDLVDVYVASEDLSGYLLWMNAMDQIADVLENSSALTNGEIGIQMVDIIEANTSSQWLTMAAVSASLTSPLAYKIDELSLYLIDHIEDEGPSIMAVRSQVQEMGEGSTVICFEIDLGDFLALYLEVAEDPVLIDHLQQCQSLLEAAVLNECHAATLEGMTGISLMFPEEYEHNEMLRYATWNVDFPDNTNWNEFLLAYYDWYATGISHGDPGGGLTLRSSCNPVSSMVTFSLTGDLAQGAELIVFDTAGRTVHAISCSAEGSCCWNCTSTTGQRVPAGVYTVIAATPEGETASLRVVVQGLR